MKIDLSTRKGYSIAAVIRGPDMYDARIIKYVFPARIRALVGVKEPCLLRNGPLTEPDIEEVMVWARKARSDDDDWYEAHFLDHYSEALDDLGEEDLAYAARLLGRYVSHVGTTVEEEIRSALVEAMNHENE